MWTPSVSQAFEKLVVASPQILQGTALILITRLKLFDGASTLIRDAQHPNLQSFRRNLTGAFSIRMPGFRVGFRSYINDILISIGRYNITFIVNLVDVVGRTNPAVFRWRPFFFTFETYASQPSRIQQSSAFSGFHWPSLVPSQSKRDAQAVRCCVGAALLCPRCAAASADVWRQLGAPKCLLQVFCSAINMESCMDCGSGLCRIASGTS